MDITTSKGLGVRIKVGSKWRYFKNGIVTVHWVKDGMVMYSWDDSLYISSDVGVIDVIERFLSDFKPIDCKKKGLSDGTSKS